MARLINFETDVLIEDPNIEKGCVDISARTVIRIGGKLDQLTQLNYGGMKLVSLNVWVCNLTNLETLNLEGNKLTSLPSEIGNLTKLISLNISCNRIKQLPPEIGKLIKLLVYN